MVQRFKNNAFGALATSLSATNTSAILATDQGSRFPALSGDDYFLATLVRLDAYGNEAEWEIVKCIARTGDALTLERGQEGTSPQAWMPGTRIEMRATSGFFNRLETSGLAEAEARSSADAQLANEAQSALTAHNQASGAHPTLKNAIAAKAAKAANAVAGNLATLDASGDLTDSGKNVAYFEARIDLAAQAGSMLGDGFFFGKTTEDFVPPAPAHAQENYFDFTSNTIYEAVAAGNGLTWQVRATVTPAPGMIVGITGAFWDLEVDPGNPGRAQRNQANTRWIPFPDRTGTLVLDGVTITRRASDNAVQVGQIGAAHIPNGALPGNKLATNAAVTHPALHATPVLRNIVISTADLEDGVSTLPTGAVCMIYGDAE